MGSEFLFGIALQTAAMIVFSFILFGHFLFGTGGASFLINLAQALMGRFRGGAAKICIVASTLMGTLSGSAVGNVAAVGVLTIPMMKRVGYPAHFAGGVEAVSSTGGCIMPPIMGAAAFIMAQFLGIPYATVALAALVPALLYYISIFIQVDLRAAKIGLKGMSKEEVPSLTKTLKDGWIYIIPVLVLLFCLFALFLRESVAALYSLAALLLVVLCRKDVRKQLKNSLNILEETTQGMLEVTVICAAAGLVVGVITYTGLGLSLCRVLTDFGGGNLLLLAILTALASIVLGMGMPVTASYLLLAVLVAPAMEQLGVPALLAHMFVFYYGTLSFLTPPVCLAAYAAASIANAPMMPTAWQAIKLGIAAYIVPFIFLFKPGLLLIGSTGDVVLSILDGVLGIAAVAIGVEGHLRRDLSMLERALFIIAGIILLIPGWWSRIVGFGLFVLITVFVYRVGLANKQKEVVKIS
ncbi:MAG: TRAP transporter fused permease subunit [Desulfotomaculaceae bacterium]|nr:TRAP transporter fused permease subunit [Desulfotomaculaceae bacterium]